LASQAYLVLPLLKESRSSDHWMDFNFFGDQLVIHLVPKNALQEAAHNNALEGMTYLCRILVWCWV
jgi:extradiol dioxygenase family protein